MQRFFSFMVESRIQGSYFNIITYKIITYNLHQVNSKKNRKKNTSKQTGIEEMTKGQKKPESKLLI